jgi:hypothetical protein
MSNEPAAEQQPGAGEASEPQEQSEPQERSEPASDGGASRRRSQEFRRELLTRLPELATPQWQPSEALNVYQELQGIVDLDADAFLRPLAKIAEEQTP